MANPTRLEIEANYARPTYKVELLISAGVWQTITNALVVNVSGSTDSTGNQDNGVSFGTPSDPSATVEMEDYLVDGIRYMHNPYWINKPVRISFGFAASNFITVYQGPITSMNRTNENITLDLGGSLDYLLDVKLHSPIYYRRAAATKTTIATQENPDEPYYIAGLINLALWRAGGRPLAQQGIRYIEGEEGWRFWYSCEQALVAPDYGWFSGDNTQDEVFAIARAVGGQLYQDTKGTVRYTQPLTFGDTSDYVSFFTFTDTNFVGYSESVTKAELLGTLKMLHTPRRVEPMQDVINDTTPRLIHPYALTGQIEIIELAPSLPVYQYQGLRSFDNTTATNTMQAILIDNRIITPTISTVEQYANKVFISVSNPDPKIPMIITSIKIQGRPLAANDEILTQYPPPGYAYIPEKTVENNVYVQNEIHAKRLIRMIYDFYNELRPIITLDGVMFDPDRYIGEIVQLASRYNNDSAAYYRIIKIGHDQLGTSMSVGLVQITNLPRRGDMFIIGNSYSGSTSKRFSY